MATAYRGRTLKKRLEAMGVGQAHLARVMGSNQPMISQLLAEKMPMPRGWSTKLLTAMSAICAREQAGVAGEPWAHYPRCGCRRGGRDGSATER